MTEATTTPKPTASDATRAFLNRKRDGVLERITSLGAKIAASKPAQALKAAEAELAEIDALLGKLEPAPGAAAETAPATSIAATPAGRIVAEAAFVKAALQNAIPAHVAADDAGPIPAGPMVRS